MNCISFKKITNDNLRQIIELSDTLDEAQRKCVAMNGNSLAQAYVNQEHAWPRAIYLDDTPIGFIMLDLTPDDIPEGDQPAIYLWRFMIAKDYQNKGYGKKSLDLLIRKCKDENKKSLYLSCEIENDMPYQFYIKYGFIDTGIFKDDEQSLMMKL